MPEIALTGCTPEPLMSYLKALGVFRLVAEQADPEATLAWRGGIAHINSRFARAGLLPFFLQDYQPTPIVAPWNGGSGFYGGGSEPLNAIRDSSSYRLAPYRASIAAIRSFIPDGTKDKPQDEQKQELLVRCRRDLPDNVVPWLDTCFVLGEDATRYFPLLGTGGNDGRLDFTNNFMQRVADVLAFEANDATESSTEWLTAALFADTLTRLAKSAIGQFNPGGIGGANAVQGRFEGDSRVNPWDYVLMIEGALLFAGSAARRLGTQTTTRAAFPFTVDSVAVGYGSATVNEETTDGSRAELWLPVWDSGATLPEIAQTFAEGRAQLGRGQARNAVEFSLAASLLGVSRGIRSFTRYGFLKRNGLAFLATPLGKVQVKARPLARLLEDPPLADWHHQLRLACRDKDKTPARYQVALRTLDRAMFAFTNRSESGNQSDRQHLVAVLCAAGQAERTLASGLSFCHEKYIRPLQRLSENWVDDADDRSPEFALALSVAGIQPDEDLGPFRSHLEEVEFKRSYVTWSAGSTSAVWSNRSLIDNLVAAFRRRQLEAYRAGLPGVPLASRRPTSLAHVLAFLRGEVDEEKLHDLIWGLSAIDWPEVSRSEPAIDVQQSVPYEFGVPRLLTKPHSLSARTRRDGSRAWRIDADSGDVSIVPDDSPFLTLASARKEAVQLALDQAARRMKSSGVLVAGFRNRRHAGKPLNVVSRIDATRLLASMLFPLSDADLGIVANSVLFPPEIEE